MAVIDELIIKLSAEEDPVVRRTLENVVKRQKKVTEAMAESGEEIEKNDNRSKKLDSTNKNLNKTLKNNETAWGGVTSGLRTVRNGFFAIEAATTATAGALVGLSLQTSTFGRDMTNLSYSLQLPAEDVQAIGSVFNSLGSSLEEFASNAESYRMMTGFPLTVERLVDLGQRFSIMSEGEALNLGRAFGLSDNLIRIARDYNVQLEGMVQASRDMGRVNSPEQLRRLSELNNAWSAFGDTFSTTANTVGAGLAEGLIPAFDAVNKALSGSQGEFEEWSRYVGNAVRYTVEGMVGQISIASDRIAQFNKQTYAENISSSDSDVRSAQIQESQAIARRQSFGAYAGYFVDLANAALSSKYTITDANTSLNAALDVANLPAEIARQQDEIIRRGGVNNDSFWIDAASAWIYKDLLSSGRFDHLTDYGIERNEVLRNESRNIAQGFLERGIGADMPAMERYVSGFMPSEPIPVYGNTGEISHYDYNYGGNGGVNLTIENINIDANVTSTDPMTAGQQIGSGIIDVYNKVAPNSGFTSVIQ